MQPALRSISCRCTLHAAAACKAPAALKEGFQIGWWGRSKAHWVSFFFLFFNCESGFASRTPSYLERFVAGALGSLSAYVISILSIRRAPLCFTEFWRRVEQEQAGLCLAARSASHVTLWLRASTAALSPALMEMGIPQISFSVLPGNSTAFSWVRF